MEGPSLTIETLLRTKREMEDAQLDWELDILLSDNGPAILSLMHGGQLIEVAGQYFVIAPTPISFYTPTWTPPR
jgi:hypothetical protein